MMKMIAHRVTRIEVRPIERTGESVWRDIVLHFADDDGRRLETEITAFAHLDASFALAMPGDEPDVDTAKAALLDAMAPARAAE